MIEKREKKMGDGVSAFPQFILNWWNSDRRWTGARGVHAYERLQGVERRVSR